MQGLEVFAAENMARVGMVEANHNPAISGRSNQNGVQDAARSVLEQRF